MFALDGSTVNKGNIRETFFANQLKHRHTLHLSKQVDFIIDRKYSMEVGGKNKTRKQLSGLKRGYLVKDDIEVGAGKNVPLWLFGFLY
jgi:hypothetical protein